MIIIKLSISVLLIQVLFVTVVSSAENKRSREVIMAESFKALAEDGNLFCEAWIGTLRVNTQGSSSTELVKGTLSIPLIKKTEDPLYRWGFSVSCKDNKQVCNIKYQVHTPTAEGSEFTNKQPALTAETNTTIGSAIGQFDFDETDLSGKYRMVLFRDNKLVCDVNVQVVKTDR